jgi:hypothetical protein
VDPAATVEKRKHPPQDPGCQAEPGAPPRFLSLRKDSKSRSPVDRTRMRNQEILSGHPPNSRNPLTYRSRGRLKHDERNCLVGMIGLESWLITKTNENEKRGTPRAVLLSLRDYVRLSAPEPEVLRAIGRESEAKGTDKLGSRQIDKIIRETRASRTKRK